MSIPPDPADPVPRLARKLAEVRRRGLTCFGSAAHQFQWNDPLTEPEVAAFEAEHGIELPDGYRRFLIEAGNGGAGPYYGIVPLAKWNWTADGELAGYLARPAVIRPNMPATADWEAALECPWEDFFQGTMTLVEGGCTYYTNLVVAGPHRGRVVNLDMDMGGPPYFTQDGDFLAWYERWLDELLAGYNTDWYGTGLAATEAELTAMMLDPATTPEIVREALYTIGRMPTLGWDALEATRGRLDDASAEIRVLVLGCLVQHRHPEAVADLIRALDDAAPSVRECAVRKLTGLPQPMWAIIRRALDDPDPGVIAATLHGLQASKTVTGADVRRFLVHPNRNVRSAARWVARSLPPDPATERMIVDLLTDPDLQTRRDAVHRLAACKDRAFVPDLVALLCCETAPEVLESLVRALGQLGPDLGANVAVPRLIELAGHADSLVRWEVAQTLGKLGDTAALPTLRGLLNEEVKPWRSTNEGGSGRTTTVANAARLALAALGEST